MDREIIEKAILTAGTAPSGTGKQPWYFAAIESAEVKKKIRIGAEKEEVRFYQKRASDTWLEDLKPFGTDDSKPYLEKLPI